MAPRRAIKINNSHYKKLTANDVICPICRSILIRPITLPCTHDFCSSCFEVANGNSTHVVCCPLCGVRVGSWLRSATKSKKLINETLWKTIQDGFPAQVRNKLDRMEENFLEGEYEIKRNHNKLRLKNPPKTKSHNNNIVQNKTGNVYQSNISQIKQHNNRNSKPTTMAKRCSLRTAASTSSINNNLSQNDTKTNQNKDSVDEKKLSKLAANNFVNKEYTCRVLCQNISSNSEKFASNKDPDKQNKSTQRLDDVDDIEDRSNSIESECLYFKPIDYRRNPPSEGLAPIKVPTRRPTATTNFKVIPPSGQNKLSISPLDCAFAKIFMSNTKPQTNSDEIIDLDCDADTDTEINTKSVPTAVKRKNRKGSKVRNRSKHAKIIKTATDPAVELNLMNLVKLHTPPLYGFKDSDCTQNYNKSNKNTKRKYKMDVTTNKIKQDAQEKADFELAMKLQEHFNQLSKYVTRSSVSKCIATKS